MPRRNLNRVSSSNARKIHGPNSRLRRCPVTLSRRASSGGARLTLTLESPSNCSFSALRELAVGVEPRDFVLVLVGHQLEQASCERLGEVMRAGASLGFGRANALDLGQVALRIGLVLVVGQELGAEGDALVERPLGRRRARALEARRPLTTALQVVRGEPAPGERAACSCRSAAPLSSIAFIDRLQRQRDRAALERKAEHERSWWRCCRPSARWRARWRRGCRDRPALTASLSASRIAPAWKSISGLMTKLAVGSRSALTIARVTPRSAAAQRRDAGGDHDVAAENEVGAARRDADSGEIVRPTARCGRGS